MVEMHRAEKLLVNSPLATWLHRDLMQPRMLALARRPILGPVLDVGIGQGATTEGLLDRIPGARVVGLEYDREEVERARRRVGGRIDLHRGDAASLPYRDASFGTVTEMDTLHHVPAWRAALRELHRVLRPGGQLLFNDYTRRFLGGLVANPTFQPGAFTAAELAEALQDAGFRTVLVEGAWVVRGRADKAP